MQSLLRLKRMWPMMDQFTQDSLRDFLQMWQSSWVACARTMSEEQRVELLQRLDEELRCRADAMEGILQDLGEVARLEESEFPIQEIPCV